MKSRRWYAHSILFAAAVVVSLSNSAFADGGNRAPADEVFADTSIDVTPSLPGSINAWADSTEGIDLGEANIVSLSQFPQGRLSTKPPLIDWSKWEIGAYFGVVTYSADFKADPDYNFGINTRVPIPAISWIGEWGAWGEVFMGHIARDIPFYYPKSRANWFGLAGGLDWTFLNNDTLFLRAQGGIMYAYWNDIYALKNGAGVIVGGEVGFYWIKHYPRAVFSINPQLNFDGDNWIFMVNFGFSYDF